MDHQPEKLEQFLQARHEHVIAKRMAASAYDAMRELERELVKEMQDMDLRAYTRTDGTKIHLRKFETCTVTQDNELLVREWLRGAHGDDKGFEKLSLNKPAIVDWLKEEIEAGKINETSLPDFLNYRSGLGVVVTEAKASA